MPSPAAFGAHYVLRQSTPGHTHRLSELLDDAHADEVTVRREVDALALDGQVERLYVGEHVMVKKTDEFDHENAPDVEAANAPGSESAGLTRGLSPADYEPPGKGLLDPSECYDLLADGDGFKPPNVPTAEKTGETSDSD